MPHPANQNQTCANCLYFVQLPKPNREGDDGSCRRRCPTVIDHEGTVECYFPWTRLTMWCGEWAPAPVNHEVVK